MGQKMVFFGVLGLIVALLLSSSIFIVMQWEVALVRRFGEVVKWDYKPGLYWKIPVIDDVLKFDGRILTLDSEPERFLTSEKKNVVVDSFVKWRIADVKQFYISVGGDERQAALRLDQSVKKSMKEQFSKRTIQEVVSTERNQILTDLMVHVKENAEKLLGLTVVDVRLKRVDLPKEVSESVFRRMRAERERIARDFRSRGAEAAEKIRANADRDRTILLSEAYENSEKLRGDGDALSAEIYAKAYMANPEFYSFHRSLNAYKKAFANRNDILVLEPQSDFFRYFNHQNLKPVRP